MEKEAIGFGLPIKTYLIFSLMVTVILAVASFLATRRKGEEVPTGWQNFCEALVEFLAGQIEPEVGSKLLPLLLPWLGAFFLYILVANWLGLIPFFLPPTSDLSTTVALSVTAIVGIQIIGFRINGVWGTIKQWFKPVWWLFILLIPLRIIDNLARVLSLSLRLFGNLAGEHLVFEQVSHVVPYVLPIILLLIGVLVGLIQAVVFTLLNLYYLIEETGLHGEEHSH